MSRRLVVVLFLDLVGWTALAERVDPEPLQVLLEQYYGICSAAIEDHGGVVEKFIGDAVMAVFGTDRSGEDDALRALRAACDIRAGTATLVSPLGRPVDVHCGIAAGEALVTHSPRAGLRIVGDVVNLAARLQSAAVAGEIIVNDVVADLARQHFAMVPVPPLTVKGKELPVAALRAGDAYGAAGRPDDGAPMVDRDAERARIRAAYDAAAGQRRTRTVTVLGPPGVGKSRLVREVLAELAAAGAVFTAVTGTCPSYGPNGNHVTLLQVLDALAHRGHSPRLTAVLDGLRQGADARAPGVEEVSWAARELLTAAAGAQPLVVVWDGLDAAGLSLLRLIGELTRTLWDLPLLMICAGRPELMERGAPWVRGPGDEVICLGPLGPQDSASLVALLSAAGAEVQAHEAGMIDRVTAHSAGNPLFIRLMVESSGGVPPTITALVGAALDRLPAPARELLGAAAVAGSSFTVRELDPLGTPVAAADLETLVRRGLIRPAERAGGYSFVQQPVHEVAYGRLDKNQRLTWHRALAAGGVAAAFHLAAAVRLLAELRPHDAGLPALTREAADALLHEGTAALRQRDVPAAIELLGRAVELLPGSAVAAIRLSDALLLSGDLTRAVSVIAASFGSRACLAQRYLLDARRGIHTEVPRDLEGDTSDRLAGCRFEQLRMLTHLACGRFGAAERAARAALGHAKELGDDYEQERLLVALCEIRQWSPVPLAERLAHCAELAGRFAADPFLLMPVLVARARSLALTGDSPGAHAALAEAGAIVTQLRLTMGEVLISQAAGLVTALDGDHRGARGHFQDAASALEKAGHAPTALTLRVQAARELITEDLPRATAEIGGLLERHQDMEVRGRLLALSTAARLGVAAPDALTSLLATTDDPCLRGDVYFDLARAHRTAGDDAAADRAVQAAIASYAGIGAEVPLRSVRAWS
ncbi:adenylate/guanylate cyclase domain-containing protein [Winogradskya humida]|uniref:Guanylate cyclase domain-containing protein n=1 Tax=Winogradskya humida TaxID=113566 RepID=A0ABQ3ZJP1_9ACTN|nr:adenylate/guanylate cyclase domain-containing protein [Actinoplanes humidus]GIE18717.1 hypothetical protein Ahu01nite_018190 [Actinoplanes humidus]